jgi:hypothetical protein
MAKQTTIDSTTKKPLWKMRVRRGDSWPPWHFTVQDSSGTPRDLTGAEILMQIKNDASESNSLKTLTHLDGFAVDALNGKITFDTEVDIQAGKYVADLEILYSSGERKTYFDFEIEVEQDKSR